MLSPGRTGLNPEPNLLPIAHALAWPDRFESGAEPLDLLQVKSLEFDRPDDRRFPCLGLAYGAVREGQTMPAVLNAANEEAVSSFLDGRIRFTSIADTIRFCMDTVAASVVTSIECVLEADRRAREVARRHIADIACG